MSDKDNNELSRNERVALATRLFGLYMLPLHLADAKTQGELTDIDCAMDNARVPFYRDQLTEEMKKILEEDKQSPSSTLERLKNMSSEDLNKLLDDIVPPLAFDASDLKGPLDFSDIGKPLSVAAFEIPRDENGKIDIAKLPEEIRDTIEMISELFSESTAQSEEVIEQMIKVARMNSGHFPEFPFDLPVIRQSQLDQMTIRGVGNMDDTIRQSRVAALALNRAPSVEPTQEQRDLFNRQRDMQLLGPDRKKAEMFDFTRPLRHQAIINSLSGGGKKHYGVLSTEEELKQQGYKTMANKSVGESEYIRPEDRDGLLSEFSPEEQMGMKLPDDLAAKLSKPLPEGKIPFNEEVIPTGFGHLSKMVEGGIRREDMVVFGSKTPVSPRSVFGPVFDQARAQRELYKGLILRLNKEIEEGPLAGLMFVAGVTRGMHNEILFKIDVKMAKGRSGYLYPSFKAGNRTRAYQTYYGNLFEKYRQEIRDAEAKAMERE